MLRHEGTAVRNAAVQRHRGEMRAAYKLGFRPRHDSRNHSPQRRTHKTDHPEIRADRRNSGLISAGVRTQTRQLQETGELFAANLEITNASYFPDLLRKRLCR